MTSIKKTKKQKGGAVKVRELKKIKLQNAAQSCYNIKNLFQKSADGFKKNINIPTCQDVIINELQNEDVNNPEPIVSSILFNYFYFYFKYLYKLYLYCFKNTYINHKINISNIYLI